MTFIDSIGYIAAALTSLSFIPQALKALKSGKTEGLSLGMYSLFTLGVGLWIIYGFIIGSWPIIAANIVTFLLAALILSLVFKNHRL